MKKLLILIALYFSHSLNAQTGFITTIAGNGIAAFSGDGGAAVLAQISNPVEVAVDMAGNIYIADIGNYRIRKISTSGIITTVAGNGHYGFMGDGGPATSARISSAYGICFDTLGNMYFADNNNSRIRKINSAGIITTVAGNGTSGYGGDGGPATLASLNGPVGVVVDNLGSIYITDAVNNRIRWVNSSGIIATIAGTGVAGFSGDGGFATAATFYSPEGIAIDGVGDIYISDYMNNRVRKINPAGIITTVAGNGTGFSGDGGPATNAGLSYPLEIALDAVGNLYVADNDDYHIRKINTAGIITSIAGTLTFGYNGDSKIATLSELNYATGVAVSGSDVYIADYQNHRIRKVNMHPDYYSDSFGVYINKSCSGPSFTFIKSRYSPSLTVKTCFGDTNSITSTIIDSGTTGYAFLVHSYNFPGHYTIKHILMAGSIAIDSISYTYEHRLCNDLSLELYYDSNSNCIKDSTDKLLTHSISAEVDSNGLPIDTLSIWGGYYYRAYGNPGDVYTFKVISPVAGIYPTCPLSGIIHDTLQSVYYNNKTKYIGFNCTTSSAFDLGEYVSTISGRHMVSGNILITNNYCTLESANITLNVNPKYVFGSSYPAPSSVVGNLVTWDLSSVSATNMPPMGIHYTLNRSGTWLIPGDTILSSCLVGPTIGDVDSGNNNWSGIDTVKGSFDPNEISVVPQGEIAPGTQLQYTINFENDGNDTAINIYVMDTLSDALDIHSLAIMAASSAMNISTGKYAGHNIIKFDFPNIKLPDSIHHDQCQGMLMFKIKTKSSLPNGTSIPNHAGIFFDDNPVVMTDTVENVIMIYSLSIAPAIDNKISLYPNPVSEVLNISGITQNTKYRLLNVTGACLQQEVLLPGTAVISLKNFPTGFYILELTDESNGKRVYKVIKE